jgi:hypothetical protein
MFPYDPTENNFKIAREFISKFDRISKFKYQDLKTSATDCLASANTLTHGWASADVPCGAIVILSGSVEEYQFSEIKDGLSKFLEWFKDLTQSISTEFIKEKPGFDFVETKEKNEFKEWLDKNLDENALKAINKVMEIFKCFIYYANDTEFFKNNPVKVLIDHTLNKQISENLSLRTVLEALGLKFIEGD